MRRGTTPLCRCRPTPAAGADRLGACSFAFVPCLTRDYVSVEPAGEGASTADVRGFRRTCLKRNNFCSFMFELANPGNNKGRLTKSGRERMTSTSSGCGQGHGETSVWPKVSALRFTVAGTDRVVGHSQSLGRR